MALLHMLGWLLLAMAVAGSGYMLAAAVVLRRSGRDGPVPPAGDAAVTVLKPLHGDEPRLADNLATFLDQEHGGPIQLLCGVHAADDPATRSVAALREAGHDVDLVVDPTPHGSNGKIANLVNMTPAIHHKIVVLSDSDIAVAPDYLARLLAALDAPGVGAVTCLYRGRGDAGFWSRFAAAGLSYQFLPGVAFGVAAGLATPCMGSTIALRRDTLRRIGGFARFVDTLADDYAIGTAVRELGLTVAVPPLLVVHACSETSLGEVWRHELRWAATVRSVAPRAYLASIVSLPLPLAMLGAALAPGRAALAIVAVALIARLVVRHVVDRWAGARSAPAWLLPVRDLFGFVVFIASFAVRSVDWRRSRLRMTGNGRVAVVPEPTSQ